jgi:hypothetical protein
MIARAVAAIMPPITPVPIEWRLAEPAPVPIANGKTPKMNASEVMTIGRNLSKPCRFDRGIGDGQALAMALGGKFHDQDRIFRGEASA